MYNDQSYKKKAANKRDRLDSPFLALSLSHTHTLSQLPSNTIISSLSENKPVTKNSQTTFSLLISPSPERYGFNVLTTIATTQRNNISACVAGEGVDRLGEQTS